MTVAFDTLRFSEKLIAGGFESLQAKALAEAFADATGQELVTKSDLKEMEARLTLRFGAMIAAGVAVLAAMKFFGH